MLRSQPNRWISSALLLTFLSTSSAHAIDIVLTYDGAKSAPPGEDLKGEILTRTMARAAEIWESAFPDAVGTFKVTYHWQEDPKKFLGIHDADLELGRTTKNVVTGHYTIRFFTKFQDGTTVPWFLDSTPEDDAEFTGGPTQVLRLSKSKGTTMGGGVYAPLPKTLEVSYSFTSSGSDATTGKVDLLSVALHELGHVMGLNFWDAGIRTHYDADASLCHPFICTSAGGTCTVRIGATSSGAHLDAPSLMSPSSSMDVRMYPSQVDILAIAAARGWTSVTFPRMEMLPPATSTPTTATLRWDQPSSWFGNQVPDGNNDVYIRYPFIEVVQLYSTSLARNVILGSTGTLSSGRLLLATGGQRLYASDTVTIDNDSTELRVESGGAVQAETAIVIDGGSLLHLQSSGQAWVFGDRLQIVNGEVYTENGLISTPNLFIEAPGTLRGRGEAKNIVYLRNDGLIEAFEGDLYFRGSSSESPMDLDGDGRDGRIEAVTGGITFEGSFPDDFSSQMDVGQFITFVHPAGWSLGLIEPKTGTINLQGDDATITAPFTSVGPYGAIYASAARTRIDSPIRFSSGSRVSLSKTTASLAFLGETEFEGGSFTGNGVLYQVGHALILEDSSVQIDAAVYQWDGEDWLSVTPGTSHTTVERNAQLKITKNITHLGSDGYDGVVTVKEGAVLDLDLAWQLDGVLCLQGGTVRGGSITVSSTGSIVGWGEIETDVTNHGTIYCSGTINVTGGLVDYGVVTETCPNCP